MKNSVMLISIALVALPAAAAAEETSGPSAAPDRGAFVAGGKVGGNASFNGLGPFVNGGLELGYVFPWLNRGLGLYVDAGYTVPRASGTANDPRVGGAYSWSLTQKQLTVTPMIVYRMTQLGRFVPYAGVGPRIYMMESVTKGSAGNAVILETKERSTKVGVGVPLGVDILVGPGAVLAEFLFEIGPLDHTLTGNTHTGAASLSLGYRLML